MGSVEMQEHVASKDLGANHLFCTNLIKNMNVLQKLCKIVPLRPLTRKPELANASCQHEPSKSHHTLHAQPRCLSAPRGPPLPSAGTHSPQEAWGLFLGLSAESTEAILLSPLSWSASTCPCLARRPGVCSSCPDWTLALCS